MGYKIPDLKEDIKNTVMHYMATVDEVLTPTTLTSELCETIADQLCDRVDEEFEKIER
jgi:hypothetical protein